MVKSSKYRTGRQCIFDLHVHLVFITRCRGKVFTSEVLEAMRGIFVNVCLNFESQLNYFEGKGDYVYLQVHYPPKVTLSRLVNILKAFSSRDLRRQFPELEPYYLKGKLWCHGYFAGSCGGPPLAHYIEHQKTPD